MARSLALCLGVTAGWVACVGDEPVGSGPGSEREAGTSDAQVPAPVPVEDAASDSAAPPPDASLLGFCASRPTPGDFCADFDQPGQDVGTGWTIAEVTGESDSPNLADTGSSPPHSMRVAVHRTDGGVDHVATSRESFQAPYADAQNQSPLVLEFAIYVESSGPSEGPVSVAGLGLTTPLSLALEATDAGSELELSLRLVTGESIGRARKTVPLATWTRISLRLSARQSADGGPVGGGMTLSVDGTSQTIALPEQPLASNLRVDVGLGFQNFVGGEWTVLYDDVYIDGVD